MVAVARRSSREAGPRSSWLFRIESFLGTVLEVQAVTANGIVQSQMLSGVLRFRLQCWVT
ncbi:MAG: hypothetical protein EBT08_23060 [Betaproteobacteria bacterium]|nr:hypothetical protein [Betaproteobacteria bacterium]